MRDPAFKLLSGCLILAGAAAAAGVCLIAPKRPDKELTAPFKGRTFAHRGLFEKDQSVPENSLPAFVRAAEAGYGIELDVQLSSDGQVVVFHDDDLKRACGVDKMVRELSLEELSALRLFGTDETIPLFTDVLSAVGGRVPLIVELKSAGPNNNELSQKTARILAEYEGDYCIESFDPRIVRYFRKNLPHVLRGQLMTLPNNYGSAISAPAAKVLSIGLLNFLGRPHFIAYKIGALPLSVKLAHRLGAMNVRWTSHSEKDAKDADLVIFEHYRPPLRVAKS